MPDPDLTAVLLALVIAGTLALPSALSWFRRRKAMRRLCEICGRLLILGEQTCDCTMRRDR
jgi:hypothetical protein